jgi:hypothetical protein
MGFGNRWSTGFGNELGKIADGFNAAKTSNPAALAEFVRLVRAENVELIEAQGRTIFPNGDGYQAAKAAANWYGTTGKPMWPANSVNRPKEIRALMTEARVRLAECLVHGAKDCKILGQCEQPKFEIWLTWPPGGFQGQTVTMWVFGPNHAAYGSDPMSAERSAMGEKEPETEAERRAWETWQSDLNEAVHAAEDAHGALDPAALFRDDDFQQMVWKAVYRLKAGKLLYRETQVAIADDREVPLEGGMHMVTFTGGHEPGMEQRGDQSKLAPAGPAADGVRITWER